MHRRWRGWSGCGSDLGLLLGKRFYRFFGFWRYSYSYSNEDNEESKYTLWDVGCGAFFTTWCGPVNLYFGGRVGILRASYSYKYTYIYDSSSITSDGDGSRTDWVYGPAVGGEYFFTKNLSIGGEIQFNFQSVGEWKWEDEEEEEEDTGEYSESIMYTRPLIFVRWYLGCK
jgi:opacity protein-like surface antigen